MKTTTTISLKQQARLNYLAKHQDYKSEGTNPLKCNNEGSTHPVPVNETPEQN